MYAQLQAFELTHYLLFSSLLLNVLTCIGLVKIYFAKREDVVTQMQNIIIKENADLRQSLLNQQYESSQSQQSHFNNLSHQLNNSILNGFKNIAENSQSVAAQQRQEQTQALKWHADVVGKRIDNLTQNTEQRLDKISDRVNEKLNEGFAKSIETFNRIMQRLALIDEAQKQISELSTNVTSLQTILADKRSRGAFGEVQLYALLENTLAPNQFSKQAKLSNDKIADAILELPQPTGRIVIDSKFPLESYQRMTDLQLANADRNAAIKQFKQDVKKHITDIATKYIIRHETADSAILFLPAEAIFAEIHAHHNDLVELAWQQKIWLTSPTTLMAVLTTAKAVLKDEATREQVHIIQQHLTLLSDDFNRFGKRFDQLARHIDQAANDVKQIHTSAQKISGRFNTIENLNLNDEISPELADNAGK
ncbi:DNA recombination protein RmuC [Saccharobesus litoralis]|uniref:DNA recombination protein RmuC n=1 Tax=Saccharobesus litoralis TaxID=2172099 RepID=A0A2S0VTY0_9ALTE|nr:DNA recombination protein RmuC [Saccharobesus litoralis]AWB67668.1 DNA recombination protein RmuC [Saccharobesus litoralis]